MLVSIAAKLPAELRYSDRRQQQAGLASEKGARTVTVCAGLEGSLGQVHSNHGWPHALQHSCLSAAGQNQPAASQCSTLATSTATKGRQVRALPRQDFTRAAIASCARLSHRPSEPATTTSPGHTCGQRHMSVQAWQCECCPAESGAAGQLQFTAVLHQGALFWGTPQLMPLDLVEGCKRCSPQFPRDREP